MRPFILLSLLVTVCLVISAAGQSLPDAPSTLRLPASPSTELEGSSLWTQSVPLTSKAVLAEAEPTRKVMDRNFILLGALTFGLTAMDVEMTQHCLHEKTCVELNPTLPHSRLGMYAANTPVNLAVMYWSYKRKAAGKKAWWVAPLVDIGAHAVGIGSNIRFLR